MFDATRNDLTLGVVGTGLMGRGIAQIAIQAGVAVRLFDTRAGAAAEACDAVGGIAPAPGSPAARAWACRC